MDDSKIELLEYLTEDGENPFHKWLNSLKDRFARARIRVRLNRVRLGNFGDCKPVGKGVNELRVDYGPSLLWEIGDDPRDFTVRRF
jgi:putative component of toxin-antitoxin plasmid stabilization module